MKNNGKKWKDQLHEIKAYKIVTDTKGTSKFSLPASCDIETFKRIILGRYKAPFVLEKYWINNRKTLADLEEDSKIKLFFEVEKFNADIPRIFRRECDGLEVKISLGLDWKVKQLL